MEGMRKHYAVRSLQRNAVRFRRCVDLEDVLLILLKGNDSEVELLRDVLQLTVWRNRDTDCVTRSINPRT